MVDKTNGTCNIHNDGCTKFQLLEARVDSVEDFVAKHDEAQRENRRWQRGTAAGVVLSILLILLKIALG